MKIISIVLAIFLSGLFAKSCAMPIYALELGASQDLIHKQKLANINKKNRQNLLHQNSVQRYSKTLDLSIPNVDYSKPLPKINKAKYDEAVAFLEKRLKMDELKLDLTYEDLSEREKVLASSVRNLSMLGFAMFAVL